MNQITLKMMSMPMWKLKLLTFSYKFKFLGFLHPWIYQMTKEEYESETKEMMIAARNFSKLLNENTPLRHGSNWRQL